MVITWRKASLNLAICGVFRGIFGDILALQSLDIDDEFQPLIPI
jgi:hypothetical protein